MTDRKIDTNKIKLLIEMYNEGQSYKKIANKLNVNDKTIANYVKLLIKQEKINKRQGNAKKITEDKIKFLIEMYNEGQSYKKIANKLNVNDKTIGNYVKLLTKQGKIKKRQQINQLIRFSDSEIQRIHPKYKYMTYNYLIDLILMEKGYNYISASHLNTRIDKINVKKHFNNFKKWNISKVEDISLRVEEKTLNRAYTEVNNLIKLHPDIPKTLPRRSQRLDASAILHLYCAGYTTIYIAEHFSYPLNSVRSVIGRARKSGRVIKRKNITDKQSKLLIKLYNEGLSYKKIARRLNISEKTTSKYAKQLVKQGEVEPRLQTTKAIHFSDTEIEKLIEMYNNGLIYKEIARILNVSRTTVQDRVKQLIKQGKINYRLGQTKIFSKDEIELLIAMYNNRKPIREIAQEFGVSQSTTTKCVNSLIEHGKLTKRHQITRSIRFSDNEIKSLIEMYNNGLIYKEIAQEFGVSGQTIANYVKLLIKQEKINKRPGNSKKNY